MDIKENLIVRLTKIIVAVKDQKQEEERLKSLSPFFKMLEKELNKNGGDLKFYTPEKPSIKSEKEMEQRIDAELKSNDDMRSRTKINAGKNIVL